MTPKNTFFFSKNFFKIFKKIINIFISKISKKLTPARASNADFYEKITLLGIDHINIFYFFTAFEPLAGVISLRLFLLILI